MQKIHVCMYSCMYGAFFLPHAGCLYLEDQILIFWEYLRVLWNAPKSTRIWDTYKNWPPHLGNIVKHILFTPLISLTTVRQQGRDHNWKFLLTREISSNYTVVSIDEVILPALQSHVPLALPWQQLSRFHLPARRSPTMTEAKL